MTIGIVSAPARSVRRSLVTTVAAALALAGVPAVQAQQPAAGPSPALMSNLVYTPWTKICVPPGTKGHSDQKTTCLTGKEARTEQGTAVLAVALVEVEGESTKVRVTLPFGVAVTQGIRLIVDQHAPVPISYTTCWPLSANMGCIAQGEAKPDLIAKLKKGRMLTIEAVTLQKQTYSFPLALADFANANEGSPFDPTGDEGWQKKMQDSLPKKPEIRM